MSFTQPRPTQLLLLPAAFYPVSMYLTAAALGLLLLRCSGRSAVSPLPAKN
ncbi:hypothetical protein [Hydrogenophaga sp. PAMC20947]|uniref:hypothetical protein n=1 Tax=Hydrogenophaga sp. PAMC20947 TaxID=2565558 RepID=UPI0014473BE6|nr:hypothetical protein [Hydrogenophaga sp. PAMC20947]